MEEAQILIIEDHPLVAGATRDLLLGFDARHTVKLAVNADEVHSLIRSGTTRWALILLDLDVPGAQGLSLARELAAAGLASRTCIVTALMRTAFVEEAKALGLLGFIPKACPMAIFSDSLRSVLGGIPAFPALQVGGTNDVPRLTRQQIRVLELVGQGLSSKQMARVLEISEGTVNNHVNAIFRALGAVNRLQAFRKAVAHGIIGAGAETLADAAGTQEPSRAP